MGSACNSCSARFSYLRSKNVKVQILSIPRPRTLVTVIWLVIRYKGEISLHFDLRSPYSCRTQSPLLRALIRIPVRLHTARFFELLYIHSPFKLLRHQRSGSHQQPSLNLTRSSRSFGTALPMAI